MRRVASSPSTPGIWQSISTAAYCFLPTGINRHRAVADDLAGAADAQKRLLRHELVHLVVFGDQYVQAFEREIG